MHRLPLTSRKYSWYSFLSETESTPGSQCGWKDYADEKNPMTQSGIEPVTFRLVVRCLNQLRHHVLQAKHKNLHQIIVIFLKVYNFCQVAAMLLPTPGTIKPSHATTQTYLSQCMKKITIHCRSPHLYRVYSPLLDICVHEVLNKYICMLQ